MGTDLCPLCVIPHGFCLYFILRWMCIRCSKGLVNWSFLKTLITLHGNGLPLSVFTGSYKMVPRANILGLNLERVHELFGWEAFLKPHSLGTTQFTWLVPFYTGWMSGGVSGWLCCLHSPGSAFWDIWTFRVHPIFLASYHGLKEYGTQVFKLFILIIGLYVPVPGQTSVILVHNWWCSEVEKLEKQK